MSQLLRDDDDCMSLGTPASSSPMPHQRPFLSHPPILLLLRSFFPTSKQVTLSIHPLNAAPCRLLRPFLLLFALISFHMRHEKTNRTNRRDNRELACEPAPCALP